MVVIEDGRGTGRKAQVDDEFRLRTRGVTQSQLSHASDFHEDAYGINTPMLTVTVTGGRILYIKNTDPDNDFYFTDFWFNWNGGSTNHDRVMYGQMYFEDGAPSANNTAGGAGNLNTGSVKTALMDVEYWDEVGDGMTVVAGTKAFDFIVAKGAAHYFVDGAIILASGKTAGFNLRGEEVGEASINILGYFHDKEG